MAPTFPGWDHERCSRRVGRLTVCQFHPPGGPGVGARAEVVAVVSPTGDHAEQFAERHGIPRRFTDYRKMLELPELDMVVLGCPTTCTAQSTVAAAAAGKHVVCEKPLCLNLAEADRMIAACRKAGVKLMYAEELCFTPKYVRLKQLLDEGALGKPYLVKQCEKHDGPHAAWFWDVERSGGGVTMDMGCHAIEFFRWMLGPSRADQRQRLRRRWARYVHADKTQGDDNALIILEFDERRASASPRRAGPSRAAWTTAPRCYGSSGVAYADLLHGNAIDTYSKRGYGYAVEKAGTHAGLELHHLRGSLELRLPAGVGPLRRLRAATTSRRWSPARTAAPCWRSLFAAYASAGRAGGSTCRSRRTRSGRSICGTG